MSGMPHLPPMEYIIADISFIALNLLFVLLLVIITNIKGIIRSNSIPTTINRISKWESIINIIIAYIVIFLVVALPYQCVFDLYHEQPRYIRTILATVVYIILFIILCKWINRVYAEIPNRSHQRIKSIFKTIAEILAIFAIFFAIFSFYQDKIDQIELEKENNNMVLEYLETEINMNLELIDEIQNNKDIWLLESGFTTRRFNYYYLEQSRGIIKDKYTRQVLMGSIDSSKQINVLIDLYWSSITSEVNPEIINDTEKIKFVLDSNYIKRNQTINEIIRISKSNRERLEYIKAQSIQIRN